MREQQAASVDAEAVRRFLTFRLAGTLYALPAEYVFEVIHIPAVARIPHSPPSLLGIANLRGMVLPLVGLRELLGSHAAPVAPATMKAIVLDAGTPLALAVESVDALVTIAADRIEVRESELSAEHGEALSGAFRSESHDAVAKILDIKKLLGTAFAQQTRGRRQPRATNRGADDAQQSGAVDTAAAMLVTFEVAGQEFALDLAFVQEILPAPAVVMAVPRAEALVLGVTSVRDRLLPLISLRGLLGFPAAESSDGREKVVVMKVGGAQVGLVADRARAVWPRGPGLSTLFRRCSRRAPAAKRASKQFIAATRAAGSFRSSCPSSYSGRMSCDDWFMTRRAKVRRQHLPTRRARSRRSWCFAWVRTSSDCRSKPSTRSARCRRTITRLPKTPKFLEGVVNLRGDVLPVVDQRRRFDMPASTQPERRRLVVVRTELHRAGLIVDGVSDVLRVPRSAVEEPPALTDEIARLVRGVINLEQSQRIVLVLDPAELLTAAERGRLDAFQKASRADA